jgi:hypothetical protein
MFKRDLELERAWGALMHNLESIVGKKPKDLNGEQGWPHWKVRKKLPHFDLLEQEKLLKMHVIEYFEAEFGWIAPNLSSDSSSS